MIKNRNWFIHFHKLPKALQEEIIKQFGAGIILCLFSSGIILYTQNWTMWFPSLMLTLFVIVKSIHLFYDCMEDRYVTVSGKCVGMELKGEKKQVKLIRIHIGNEILNINAPYKSRNTDEGDIITIYLPQKTPVYEKDGEYYAYRFYAMEISRKV